eukprot:1133804-Alexandrium_andersonii.AAC.1
MPGRSNIFVQFKSLLLTLPNSGSNAPQLAYHCRHGHGKFKLNWRPGDIFALDHDFHGVIGVLSHLERVHVSCPRSLSSPQHLLQLGLLLPPPEPSESLPGPAQS